MWKITDLVTSSCDQNHRLGVNLHDIQVLHRDVIVLNKCANPECRESFRRLQGGKLFRWQCEVGNRPVQDEPEFFWLCQKCSTRMTLRLDDETKVKTVPVADQIPHTHNSVHFVPLDRKPGSFLSCLHFLAPGPLPSFGVTQKYRTAQAG